MDAPVTDVPPSAGSSSRPAGRKSTPRPAAERFPEHAHLSLDGLREYGKTLAAEESNDVPLGAGMIQARLDVVRAGSDLVSENLKPVLTDQRVGAGRQALVEVVPSVDIPPLPDLAGLWDRQVDVKPPGGPRRPRARPGRGRGAAVGYRAARDLRLGAATSESSPATATNRPCA